ncbi:MAG: hypothetical protein V4485_02980 [Pseudomonadota bacterium]
MRKRQNELKQAQNEMVERRHEWEVREGPRGKSYRPAGRANDQEQARQKVFSLGKDTNLKVRPIDRA